MTKDTVIDWPRFSVKRLTKYNATALLPGHKQFVLAGGNEHIMLLDEKMSE